MLLRFDPFRELDRAADAAGARTAARRPDGRRTQRRPRGRPLRPAGCRPGVSIDLEVERNVLSLRAERRWTRRPRTKRSWPASVGRASSAASCCWATTLDGDKAVQADYHDGVLDR